MSQSGPTGETSSAGHPGSSAAPSVAAIFFAFLQIGLMGFGGLAASAFHILVERRKWLENREFVELFAVCTVLPGGNIINASVVIGDRYRGVPGALAGVCGLMLMPLALLMVIASIYEAMAHLPAVRAGLAGAASAVAGVSIGTAAKMAKSLDRHLIFALLVAGVFAAVGIFRLSLPLTLLVAVPLSLAAVIYLKRAK